MKSQPIYADHVFRVLKEVAHCLQGSSHEKQLELVNLAIWHYAFPLTSEFYGKAMIALRNVVERAPEELTPQQLEHVRNLADAIKSQWYSAP